MRRIFLIVLGSIVLIGIGLAAYFFFFAPKGPALEVSDGNFFGSAGDAPVGLGDTGEGDGPVPAGEEFAPRLIRITEGPVALGAVSVALPSQAETASGTPAVPGDTEVRYIDRASGNVYSYKFHERSLSRISNRTLPGIQEAAWLSDGSTAFTRFLVNDANGEHVATYALPATGEGGYFLDRGIEQVAVSGTTTIFTLLSSSAGSVGTVANPDGSNPRTLFTSNLSNVIVHLSNGPFIAATKPSSGLDGYAFTVGSTGTFTRILGPFRGLSVLPSPSSNYVLFSFVENRVLKLSLLDRRTGTVIALPLSTLAEKCVWENGEQGFYCGVPQGPTGNLPDDWHQGVASFRDRLWRIDVAGRVATYVINPSTEASVDIDMVGLALDGRNDVLVFKNKKDGSLWAYDL
ncbi:MAG TPA: hypothetical protein VNU47_00145 [Candidatus Paceibacterota bacterium]|nr:hypothetical protein [Candidatus Paceibacterota bacterium]